MVNVTLRLIAAKHHRESGITWVKLNGDYGFEWVVTHHPHTPSGFIAISGCANGSFRIIEAAAIEKAIKHANDVSMSAA